MTASNVYILRSEQDTALAKQRDTLRDLCIRCVNEVYGGNVLAFAEAYAHARTIQVAEILRLDEEDATAYDEKEELIDAMIGILLEWLDESPEGEEGILDA